MTSLSFSVSKAASEKGTNLKDRIIPNLDDDHTTPSEHEENVLKRKRDEVIPCKGNNFKAKSSHAHDDELRKKDEFIPKKQVAGFGAAMLRGMGWRDGTPFGRADKIIEPVEPQPRPALAGLGSNLIDQQADSDKSKSSHKEEELKSTPNPPHESSFLKHRLEAASSTEAENHEKRKAITWLLPNLFVRYIGSGRFYLKKGIVMDITSKYECTLKMESGEIVENVDEKQLETMIPKRLGTQCMVVRGKNKGFVGKLVDKNRDKEICQLKNEDDDVVLVSFDDCCEFVEF